MESLEIDARSAAPVSPVDTIDRLPFEQVVEQSISSPFGVNDFKNSSVWFKSVSPGHRLLMQLTRIRNGLLSSFKLFLEEGEQGPRHVLTAYRKIHADHKFLIYGVEDDIETILAKVRVNFIGTTFSITKVVDSQEQEIAVVNYELNMGPKQPRKLAVYIPAMDTVTQAPILLNTHKLDLMEYSKQDYQQKVVSLRNKIPQWNADANAFVLNFQGRVQLSSVKNFQIVHPNDSYYIVMQFGKSRVV